MRSISDEGEAMTNSPERGRVGPGGIVRSRSPAPRGGTLSGRGYSEGKSQLSVRWRMSGSKLKPSNELERLFAELYGAWNLKPYWGKPTVRNFRGGGWKRDHGSRTEARAERRGARASAPPDNMAGASEPVDVSTKQRRIAELARQCPEMGFTSLGHFIDIDWLREAYRRTRKDGAVGVDGQDGEYYAV